MYRKNTASQFIAFQGVDATTGGIKSGVTWTMRRCIDGTFAAGGGTVTEDGTTGWYKCALTQADTNGNNIAFNFTGSGAVPQTVNILTDGSPPDINVKNLLGTAWLTPGTAGTPDVNVKLWNALATVALPVVPTVAGRSLDISAGGEAGVDWANVGTQGSAVNLSATTTNLVNTITTYTGNTVQTGDSFGRLGVAGVGLTNLGDARIANLDATVSSRLATSGYTAPPSAASIASAVWAAILEGTYTATNYMVLFASALLGKASGLATTTAVYRDTGDTKNRISATVDADGNRTAVTLNGS